MSLVTPVPKADIRKAEALHKLFSHLPVCERTPISFAWPSVQGVFARATGIGYTSDKWDYQWRDFIHDHDSNALPWLLRQKRHGDTLWKKPFLPKRRAWTKLGHCLDIGLLQEHPDDDPYHLSYLDRDRDRLPVLMADTDRKLLIIMDPHDPDEPALLLHGRKLKITSRGIVG